MTERSATGDAGVASADVRDRGAGRPGVDGRSRVDSSGFAERVIFGMPIHAVTMGDVLGLCERAIATRTAMLVGVINAAKLVKVQRDAFLRDSVLGADVVIADGLPVVWASRLTRRPLPERVAGIDLFERLLALAGERGYGVYFLGATPEVVSSVVERARREHPGLRVAGYRDGYFAREAEAGVAGDVAASGADVLFVAMTTPKKEVFLGAYGGVMGVPVCHGVGGSFDVYAGKTRRAPRWMQNVGLEWFYRIVQEPRRMWRRYAVTNTLFTIRLVRNIASPQRRFERGHGS